VADALQQGADLLITTGGPQSNHARMTAAAACRYGMQSVLCLFGPGPEQEQGNLLLDRVYGAEVRFIAAETIHEMNEAMEAAAREMRGRGRNPYIIPVGGSTALGSLGYVLAVEELAEQARALGVRVGSVVVATGSTGTLSGILLGAHIHLPKAKVYGISVSPTAEVGRRKCAGIVAEAARMVGVTFAPPAPQVPIWDDWLGPGYGVATRDAVEMIRLAASLEGVLLDPVYTGKAMAGLRGLATRGELQTQDAVVFWHTGGTPALFAYPEQFTHPT
jgi:1-aminocyclopropane-1-carboxylate deaminase/D-cysteine desulfhydrase-like pyridoxal-dependent ACC family enzyme